MKITAAQLEAEIADERFCEQDRKKPYAWKRPPISALFRAQRDRELRDEKRLSGWDR